MESRISFFSSNIRNLFFEKAFSQGNFKSWKEFYEFFHIPRSMLDKYRFGTLTLPQNIYNKISIYLTKDELLFFSNNILFRDSNWGSIKGGKNTYKSHKRLFDLGREKAIKRSKERAKKFDINIPLNKELAYFVGLFIGDGFTNKYNRYYLIQFTGNKLYEKDYYEKNIIPISQKLFNIKPLIKEMKDSNTIRINIYSKDLFLLLTSRFKIKKGFKSHTVVIPDEILNASQEIILSCIAGIYDAEGCFYFDKRKVYKNPYPAINLHISSINLINQISKVFSESGIKHSISSKNLSHQLYIYGKSNIEDFFVRVPVINPKYSKFLDREINRTYS